MSEAIELAKAAGYTEIAAFEKRCPEIKKLP
jgi:hypothetical protein